MNTASAFSKAGDWFGKITGKAGKSIMKGNEAINSINAMSGLMTDAGGKSALLANEKQSLSALDNIGAFSGLSRTVGMIQNKGAIGVNDVNRKLLEKAVGKPIEGASVELGMFEKAKLAHMDSAGNYKLGRIAGSVAVGTAGVSTAGRIVGGGGIYKDRNGNTDLIGVPFI